MSEVATATATPAAAPAATATPAASAPAAAASPAAAAPAATATPAAVSDWMAGLNDTVKNFATNKGWKNPSEVLDSYQNLEKLVGAPQDKIIKMPDEADAEGWNSVYSKLGRPQTPADYKLEVPKEGGDPEFAKWASERFHEAGLSAKQAAIINGKWNEYAAGVKAQQTQNQINTLQQGQEKITKEWGAAVEQNTKIASRAVREFGVPKETLDKIENAIGYDGVMKLFHNIGSKIGESSFVVGDQSNGAMTPDAAKAKIQSLMGDKAWAAKYTAGDTSAVKEMHRLQQMAHYGDQTL